MEAGLAESKCPPARLEWLVQTIIPPSARETVGGDLRELYQTPSHYIAMAVRTVPFVLISHIRRNANVPVLAIQGFFIFCCIIAMSVVPANSAGWGQAAALSAVVLVAILLADAYQGPKPPSAKRAIVETILATASVVICTLSEMFALRNAHRLPDGVFALFMWGIIPFAMPVLAGLRAMMVLARERREQLLSEEMEASELQARYRQFRVQIGLRNMVQSLVLLAASAIFTYACATHAIAAVALAWSLVAAYAVVAVYLIAFGGAHELSERADFLSVRAIFQAELVRQHEIRRLVFWLSPTPLLFALYVAATSGQRDAAQPVLMLYVLPATVLLCFFVGILNRERSGRIQEKIGILARMRRRQSP